ncbi:hypothetical protein J6590_038197 [Homalodisca vitripennis]|nr:hypothetical protein J6590_038197 [Homalodisca vitripennis]
MEVSQAALYLLLLYCFSAPSFAAGGPFLPGQVYKYYLEGSTVTQLPGSYNEITSLGISATAEVFAESKCQHVLKLSDVQVKGSDGTQYNGLSADCAKPIRFSYSDGKHELLPFVFNGVIVTGGEKKWGWRGPSCQLEIARQLTDRQHKACAWYEESMHKQKSEPFRTEVAISRMYRVCQECSGFIGTARLCPHSFSPPVTITPLNTNGRSSYGKLDELCGQADDEGVSLNIKRAVISLS